MFLLPVTAGSNDKQIQSRRLQTGKKRFSQHICHDHIRKIPPPCSISKVFRFIHNESTKKFTDTHNVFLWNLSMIFIFSTMINFHVTENTRDGICLSCNILSSRTILVPKYKLHQLTAFSLSTFFFSGAFIVAARISSPLNSL